MLRNAASFARYDVGFAERIQQGRFTVIDMAHDSNHRRTWEKIFFSVALDLHIHANFDIGF